VKTFVHRVRHGIDDARKGTVVKRITVLAAISAVVALVTSLGVATIAIATIPDSNNVINACYANPKGDLRVIDSPSQGCKSGETPISWARSGLTDYEVVTVSHSATGDHGGALASCPSGKVVLGGGYQRGPGTEDIEIFQDRPNDPSGWNLLFHFPDVRTYLIHVFAICARLIPGS
jgi:hypothetical protein